jgi:hypothetical protein
MRPPTSLMAAIATDEITKLAQTSPLWPTYSDEIDRASAREKLEAKVGPPAERAPDVDVKIPKPPPPSRTKRSKADDGNVVTDYLRSREGRQMDNRIVRGVFRLLKKRR